MKGVTKMIPNFGNTVDLSHSLLKAHDLGYADGHKWSEAAFGSLALKRVSLLSIRTWEQDDSGAMAALKQAIGPLETNEFSDMFRGMCISDRLAQFLDIYAVSFMRAAQDMHRYLSGLEEASEAHCEESA